MDGQLLHGDCREVMRQLDADSVDLIYADPPFNSGQDYAGAAGTFTDRWESMDAYLQFMRDRLCAMERVLAPSGSIYLHCDQSTSHRIRCLLDYVFGAKNFRNEIIWCYSNSGRTKARFCRKHDTILAYAKGPDPVWNDYRLPPSSKYVAQKYTDIDKDGRKCRRRIDGGKARIYYPEDGVTPNDWWADIPPLTGPHRERVGWPTQKPVVLLERIISASSRKGDLVLDPFMGSGTTLVAAKRLGRRWIGIDESADALKVAQSRLDAEKGGAG